MKSEKKYILFSIYLIALKYCLYINRKKNGKSQIFVKYFYFEDGHKSEVIIFSTIGSRTSTQKRGSATGTAIGKHNGETKRETTEKNEKWEKKNYIFQFI